MVLHWHTEASASDLATRFFHACLRELYGDPGQPILAVHSWRATGEAIASTRVSGGAVELDPNWAALASRFRADTRVLARSEPDGGGSLAIGSGRNLPSRRVARWSWGPLENKPHGGANGLPHAELFPRLQGKLPSPCDPFRIGLWTGAGTAAGAEGPDRRWKDVINSVRAAMPERQIIPLVSGDELIENWNALLDLGDPYVLPDWSPLNLRQCGTLVFGDGAARWLPEALCALEAGCHVVVPAGTDLQNLLSNDRGSLWKGGLDAPEELVELLQTREADPLLHDARRRRAAAWSKRWTLSREAACVRDLLATTGTFGPAAQPTVRRRPAEWVVRREVGIGDVVFTLSVAHALKRRDPDCKVTLHTSADHARWAEWFPCVDRVTSGPFRPALAQRVGDFEAHFPSNSPLDRTLALAREIGLDVDELAPEPVIPPHLLQRAKSRLKGEGPFIAFLPSSRGCDRARSLPPEIADTAARRLTELGTVLWLGERPRGRSRVRGTLDFSGKLPLPLAIAILAQCDLCVSVDSGLLHVATVLRKRTVGLFSHIAALRRLWLADRFVAVEPNLPCSPCGEGPGAFHCQDRPVPRGMPLPVLPCMAVHQPETIAAAARRALDAELQPGRLVWSLGPDGVCSSWDVAHLPRPWS